MMKKKVRKNEWQPKVTASCGGGGGGGGGGTKEMVQRNSMKSHLL